MPGAVVVSQDCMPRLAETRMAGALHHDLSKPRERSLDQCGHVVALALLARAGHMPPRPRNEEMQQKSLALKRVRQLVQHIRRNALPLRRARAHC